MRSNSNVKFSGRSLMNSGWNTPSLGSLSQRASAPSTVTTSPPALVFQCMGKSPTASLLKSSNTTSFSPATKSNLEYDLKDFVEVPFESVPPPLTLLSASSGSPAFFFVFSSSFAEVSFFFGFPSTVLSIASSTFWLAFCFNFHSALFCRSLISCD